MRKSIVISLMLLAFAAAGSASATPKECHGHNSACTEREAAAAATATLAVTADSTTFTASGCQAGERATVHVTYDTADGATYEVSGYTSANADGNVNATFPSGSAAAEAATGSTYVGARLTGQCGDVTFEAKT